MKRLLCSLVLLIIVAAQVGQASRGGRVFYLPPSIADRVVFYHSFAQGLKTPDLNRSEQN